MRSLGAEGVGAHIEITGGVVCGSKYHIAKEGEPKERKILIHSKHGTWKCKRMDVAQKAREILDADISVQEKEQELFNLKCSKVRS